MRFLSVLAVTALGCVLAVGAFTFSAGTERWLGFGCGAGGLVIVLVAFCVDGRGAAQRILDLILLPICAWALVSARTIELASHGAGPHLVRWLGFSAGAGIAAVGLLSLLLHELNLERDLTWAAEQVLAVRRAEAVEVHDFRDTTERDPDALPWTSG